MKPSRRRILQAAASALIVPALPSAHTVCSLLSPISHAAAAAEPKTPQVAVLWKY